MERKRIIVAFGDIRGFGVWTYRAATTREIRDSFIEDFYGMMQTYVRKHPDFHFKYIGDGFMVLRELEGHSFQDHQRQVMDFIFTLRCITRKIRKVISTCAYPAPDGFRVRIASGNVSKMMVVDPNDPDRKRTIPEYVDYAVNMAESLLQVSPGTSCLASQDVIEALGKKRSYFRVRKSAPPIENPKGVNREDLERLWVIQF